MPSEPLKVVGEANALEALTEENKILRQRVLRLEIEGCRTSIFANQLLLREKEREWKERYGVNFGSL